MDNVICDICGSEFSASLDQCPICGCAKKDASSEAAESSYVKGGRFSKSNVRRRMKPEAAPGASEAVREYVKSNDDRKVDRPEPEPRPKRERPVKPAEPENVDEDAPKSNKPLLLIVILLLLAIIAVSIYIVIAFSGSSDDAGSQPTAPTVINTVPSNKPTTKPQGNVPCTLVRFVETNVELNATVPEMQLTLIKEPVNATDKPIFESSHPDVISVDSSGKLVAHKQGSAIITVNCGLATAKLTVKSTYNAPATLPTTKPTNPTQPSVPVDGQFVKPSGVVTYNEAKSMTVDNEYGFANVRKGPGTNYDLVTKVNNGDKLTIYCEYVGSDYTWALSDKGWIVKSYLAPSDAAYQIRINGGVPTYGDVFNAECTLGVNDNPFTLKIVDSNGNPVNVEWKASKDGLVTVNNGKVDRVAAGTVTLTATYEDYSFSVKIY